MSIQPLNDRVLVKPTEAKETTDSGIFLPESAKEKPVMGKVVAVGPGSYNDDGERNALTVKVGDEVVYGKYGGTEIDLDGVKHMILGEGEILGVVE